MDNTKKPVVSEGGVRQKLTVEIPVGSLIRALELVAAGAFANVDDVMAAGIEILRTRSGSRPDQPRRADETISVPAGSVPQPLDLAWNASNVSPQTVDPLPISTLPHPLIPITIPRFLPGKFLLRFLAGSLAKAGGDFVDASSFRNQVRYAAFTWTGYVNRLDRQSGQPRGRRLSTAFPDVARDQEKSMSRFLEAYVGSPYASGPKVGGALPFLGFASLVGPPGHERIGITEAGVEFARAPNPVLDEAEPSFPPFRNDEVALIIRAITVRASSELDHMRSYVGLVRDMGRASRDSLTARMRNFYVRFWSPLDLNAGMVDSMRATVHSRCQELGFVKTEREGRIAAYTVTESGASWLRGEFPQSKGE